MVRPFSGPGICPFPLSRAPETTRDPGVPTRIFSVAVGAALILGTGPAMTAQQPPAAATEHRAAVTKYCVTCHNERAKAGGLALDGMDWDNIPAGAAVWEKALKKMRVGMMPPPSAARPDAATRVALIAWLTTTLDHATAEKPNPGRPVLHRLNRAEYANAVRDLLALDVDPSTLLPPDDSAYGFDNVGDVLGMSPVLLERFMEAANKVGALAIGDPEIGTAAETFHIRQDASQDTHVEGQPIGTVGG